MPRSVLLIALMFGALLLFTACSDTPEERAEKLHRQALAHLDNFEFAQADSAFVEMLVLQPSSIRALTGASLVLERRLILWDALDGYYKALKVDNSDIETLRAIRRIHGLLGNTYEYHNAAIVVASANDASPRDYYELARTRMLLNDLKAADRTIESATAINSDPAILDVLRANVLYLTGDFDSSNVLYQQALAEGDDAEFYERCADYLLDRSQFDSAVVMSQKALSSEPGDFNLLVRHFKRCLKAGHWFDARKILADIDARDKERTVHAVMSQWYGWAADEPDVASSGLVEMERQVREFASTFIYGIYSYKGLGTMHYCKDNADHVVGLVARLGYEPEVQNAIKNTLAEISVEIELPSIAFKRVRSLQTFDNWRLDMRHMDLLLNTRMDEDDTLSMYIEAIESRYSDDTRWLAMVGEVFSDARVGRDREAQLWYERALTQQPSYYPALKHQIAFRLRNEQYEEALAACDRHSEMLAAYPDLQLLKAEALAKTGRFDEALAEIHSALPATAGYVDLYEPLIEVFDLSGRSDLTPGLWTALREAAPENADIPIMASWWAIDRDTLEMADEYVQVSLELEPDNPELRAMNYYLMGLNGQADLAKAEFDTLLTDYPRMSQVGILQALMLKAVDGYTREAENIAKAAIMRSGQSFRARVALCRVYMGGGEPRQLRREAMALLQAFPNRPEGHYFMGVAKHEEESAGVREQLQKALDLGLPSPYAQEAREMLKTL